MTFCKTCGMELISDISPVSADYHKDCEPFEYAKVIVIDLIIGTYPATTLVMLEDAVVLDQLEVIVFDLKGGMKR